ncbi:MAG: metallophosphoesterase [Phycisphaerales bacterium]|nr:metallophosphoesterase [Phycisphaerales bacterium]
MKSSRSHEGGRDPTRIGLLSDSHGEVDRTRRAVEVLVHRGADIFIHCGDFEDRQCLDALAGLNAHICFGNCDEPTDIESYAKHLGIQVHGSVGALTVDGCEIRFMHGDDSMELRWARESGAAWLFHGHTHLAADETQSNPRVVNPGALSRAKVYTVALVTPHAGSVEFLPIDA